MTLTLGFEPWLCLTSSWEGGIVDFFNTWIPANTWNDFCDLTMPWMMLQHLSSTALKGFYSSSSNAVTSGYLGRETAGILVCWFITCIIRLFCYCFFLLWRVKVCTKTDGSVNIHPKSVNVEETEFHYNWLVYHLKMRTSSVSWFICAWGVCLLSLFEWGWIRIQKGCEQPLFWGNSVLGHSLYTPSDYVLCDTGVLYHK